MAVPIGVVPPIGTAITSPVTAPLFSSPAGAPAPGTPAGAPPPAVEENKGLWRGFFEKMKVDPNFRMAMMQTGIGMMRSAKMGESGFDVAGQAIGAGAQTLDALRQRDTAAKLAAEEKETKAGQINRELTVAERAAAAQEGQLKIAGEREAREKTEGEAQLKHAENQLQALKDKNADDAEIARAQVEVDRLRANAYAKFGGGAGGGSSAQESMIENLTAAAVAKGEDPVQARANATMKVMTTSRTGSLLPSVDAIVKLKSDQYMFSEEGKNTPPSLAMMDQWRREAQAQVMQEAAAMSGQTPTGPVRLPQVEAFIRNNKAKGVNDVQLSAYVKAQGHDPAVYGLPP